TRTVADARVGGMLSGKAGIANIHLGDGKDRLKLIHQTIEETDIPISQFWPTHANRTQEVFEACLTFAKQGGVIDFTGSENPDFWEKTDGAVRFSKALKRVLEEGISLDNFTMTSDGQGSLPYFNEQNEFIGMGVGSSKS